MDSVDPKPGLDVTSDLTAPAADPSATVEARKSTIPGSRSTSRAVPAVPGYEFREELGRGGMGVVYLARHSALKRDVALKLIRAGADADADQLERFRVEAEAVAQLHHANIVQIFEIGEHDGMPYCALEFLPGGNLAAAIKNKPYPPLAAAGLMELLARAVHHAHQKGIIHRDLKPANILLGEDGTPKITDFGLAKRLEEGNSHLTRTGAVMGTPAYMAPEQAAGLTAEIGPACDIYSLGAILYELLAGRPPFVAESAVAMLHAVQSSDVSAPSVHTSGVPRDLETICLKCLEKDKSRRYASALGLAQDLERFRAGEPILACREGVLRKTWRRTRKRGTAIAATVLVIAATAVAIGMMQRANTAGRTTALSRELDEHLDSADWPAEHRDHLESLAGELATIDPEQGDAAKRRILERFVKRFREALAKPRVAAADIPALEAEIAWLRARDPDSAKALDGELRNRLRSWQPAHVLAPPHSELAATFPGGRVLAEAGRLKLREGDNAVEPVLAARTFAGSLRVEAEFIPNWTWNTAFGVVIRASPEARTATGYSFVLQATPAPQSEPLPKDEAVTFRRTSGHSTAKILRNGVVLREKAVSISEGPVRILAERDGERLQMQINGKPVAEFLDSFPIGGEAQCPGILWPPAGQVSEFRVDVQALPPVPSALEKADDLHDRNRFAEALLLYQEQARSGGEAGDEAMCKAGICLLRLNRNVEADPVFESVLARPGTRWPIVAASQLWLSKLAQKKFDEADAVFSTVSGRFNRDDLARNVPQNVRNTIVNSESLPAMHFLMPDPADVRKAEASLKLTELLQEDDYRANRLHQLMVVQALARADLKAVETARILEPILIERSNRLGISEEFAWMARWYMWEMRQCGLHDQAIHVATSWHQRFASATSDGRTAQDPNWFRRVMLVPHLELARLHSDRKNWEQAGLELERYLKEYPVPSPNYAFHAPAALMLGFCRLQRGDAAGAEKAWKDGRYGPFAKRIPEDIRPSGLVPLSRYAMVENWMMGCLAADFTDEEAKETWAALAGSISTDPLFAQLGNALNMSPAVMRGTWSSPRGREFARKMAFQQLHPLEHHRMPLLVVLYEKFRQEIFGGTLDAEQDEAAWLAVQRIATAQFDGKLNKAQVLQLALAWKGTTGTLGWGGLSSTLAPAVRGPVAYLMARRLILLGKPDDAKACFRTAIADSTDTPLLKNLASAELARLEKK